MKRIILLFLLLTAISVAGNRLRAQINLNACGQTYTQTFNGLLPSTPAANPNRCINYFSWTDNVTVPGWYVSQQATRFLVDDGNCNTGSVYSYGFDFSSDRTLGSYPTASNALIRYGAQFRNNTPGGVNQINLNYSGRAWRGGTNDNTLSFEYSLDATSLTTGTWTPVTALDFVWPAGNSGLPLGGASRTITGSANLASVIAAGQTFWIRWTDTDDSGADAGLGIDNVTVSVNVQPVSAVTGNTAVCNNDPTNYLYTLTASPGLTYTWTGIPFQAALPLGNIGSQIQIGWNGVSAGTYFITVTGTGLACTVSRIFSVTVNALPNVGIIFRDQTVCQGTNSGVNFLSGFSGQVLRWESSTDNFITNVTPIVNASSVLPFTNLLQTTWYRAILLNGACATLTGTARVTVSPVSQGGNIAPAAAIICSPTNSLTLNLTGQVGNILRWESSTNNFASVTTIANTQTTLPITNLTRSTSYRAVVQSAPCLQVNSSVAVITVNPTAVGGTLSAAQTVCSNEIPAALNLTGSAGNIVQWESSTDNFATVNIINNTTATYTPPVLGQTTDFRVQVSSPGCGTAVSTVVRLTVTPAPVGGTLSASQTLCAGNPGTVLTLTGFSGNILRWESSVNGFLNVTTINNTLPNYDFGILTRTTRFRAVFSAVGCANVFSTQAEILVNPAPVAGMLTAFPLQSPTCNASSGRIVLSGQTGTVVRWESSTDNFATVTSISNTLTSYNYNVSVNTQFRVVLSNPGCPNVTTAPVTVTGGSFIINTRSGTQCNNRGKVTVLPTGGTAPYRYIISPASGTQPVPGVFDNVIPGRYTITAIDANNCTAVSRPFTILSGLTSPGISSAIVIDGGSVRLNWDTWTGAFQFQVRVKAVTDAVWGTPVTLAGNITQTTFNLLPNTAYQTQIRVRCAVNGTWSPYSAVFNFVTANRMENEISEENLPADALISVYPNPAHDRFTVRLSGSAEKIHLTLSDLTGKAVRKIELSDSVSETNVDVSGLPAGVYLLTVRIAEELKTVKIIVE